MKISCLIPAWNEAARIDDVLAVVAEHPELAEVIVVDDGSTDGTAERAEAVAARVARLRVIRLGVNRGKTQAIAVGVAAAAHDWLLLLDADLQGLDAAAVSALRSTISGLISTHGCLRSGEVSMTITRSCTSTWVAARPTPSAAYMVSSRSSTRRRMRSSTACTGRATVCSRGSG